MREKWKVFYNADTGQTLGSYTLRGSFDCEEEATRELLAAENGLQPEAVIVQIETRPEAGTFYLFDCMDGLLGDKLLTPAEVAEILRGRPEDLTEKQLIQIAADYEATLYRQEYEAGKLTAEQKLYDCGF